MNFLFSRLLCSTLMLASVTSYAQVGIGNTNPDASAHLQVGATTGNTKGFLPPRVALTATNVASPITSPATGLMVYNTATAGTAPNNVTPGIYYYDGAKWQRVINQQPDATISFNQNTPTTAGVVFTPNTPQSSDFVYVSSTNNSMWTWDGTNYVTYTPPSNTAWFMANSSTDAGSNKTDPIARTGKVGIGNNNPNANLDIRTSPTNASDPGAGFLGLGTTATAASSAGAGAVRYSTLSGGVLEYSNGSTWNTLTSNVTKSVVIARNLNEGLFPDITATNVVSWSEEVDINGNFDPSTGIFTAPRNGNYVFTFNYAFQSGTFTANSVIEAHMNCSNASKSRKQLLSAPSSVVSPGDGRSGAMISFVVSLNQGETIRPLIWHNTGANRKLVVPSVNSLWDGFNNLSIVEL